MVLAATALLSSGAAAALFYSQRRVPVAQEVQ
jgi:hypothetical protein